MLGGCQCLLCCAVLLHYCVTCFKPFVHPDVQCRIQGNKAQAAALPVSTKHGVGADKRADVLLEHLMQRVRLGTIAARARVLHGQLHSLMLNWRAEGRNGMVG